MRVALKGYSANYALLLFINQFKITIMIYIHEQVELCSYSKSIKVVSEQIACFANEQDMHEHCAKIVFALEDKGMSYNGKNDARHFVYSTRELSADEINFIFGKPSESHIGKIFK